MRLRGLGAHLLFERAVHVHDHRLKLRAEPLKERPDPLPRAFAPDPQDSLAGRLDDDRGVAVPAPDRKLVHADHRDTREVHRPPAGLMSGNTK